MRVIGNGRIRRVGAGISYGSGANIKQLQDWDLATDDDVPAIETAGYFNALAAEAKVGEVIRGRVDLNGSPRLQNWLISANDGTNVTVVREDSEAAGVRAVVPTADGLTTGLIREGDTFVEATSGGANNWLTLPLASAATRGREIWIWVKPAINCELRTPTGADDTINNVACGDNAKEALLTHTQLYVCRQHLDDGWLLAAFTALGAEATAIVPD